jgi:large subunit ribosomal protein L6
MSKIGKQPIKIIPGTEVSIEKQTVTIKGPKGTLIWVMAPEIKAEVKDDNILVSTAKDTKQAMSTFGTTRAILANMMTGVNTGWSKKLELVGTGYRAETDGKLLTLTVGFSHLVKIEAPENISFKVEKMVVTVDGINKETVGQVAADIRAVKPPEPYKGKGIKYVGEVIRRKAGKAAKAAGAA